MSGYIMKARQDDAVRSGERDRRLLEARRARMTRHPHGRRAGPAFSLARLMAVFSARRRRPPTGQHMDSRWEPARSVPDNPL
jgi:hypothetical protein